MIWPEDFLNQVHCADALEFPKLMPPESIHCCITSPPYWGLRDYKIEPKVWGGDKNCQHDFGIIHRRANDKSGGHGDMGLISKETMRSQDAARFGLPTKTCGKCDAWLGCLGLEPTLEMYIEHLVEIFREAKRVLREDGTLWLNLGDSYASGKGHCFNPGGGNKSFQNYLKDSGVLNCNRLNKSDLDSIGLKSKDLCGIPWRVALALQADGWWLRSDIIWSKPNPMPESVRDRPTRSHEYIFLLSKSTKYYFDSEAVREDYSNSYLDDSRHTTGSTDRNEKVGYLESLAQNPKKLHRMFDKPMGTGRNIRSVWTITTKPFKGAHFATFPPELPRRCIKASCPPSGIVLDPFAGSGTTGMEAKRLGRNYILIDIKPEYCEMARKRISQVGYQMEIAGERLGQGVL
jgi:DNA modification methylase